jgi:hypothetical protein
MGRMVQHCAWQVGTAKSACFAAPEMFGADVQVSNEAEGD